MASPVGERGGPRSQGIDSVLSYKDGVACGLGQLLDAGSDVDRVADQGELQLAPTADRARDHHTGVDPDPDPQRTAESLSDKAFDHNGGAHRGVSMTGEVVRRAEYGQRSVAEELVDMPTDVDDRRHHDLEQGVEAGDGVLGGVDFGERGEVADIHEHHAHLAALTGEDVVALLEQPRRQTWVDVSTERRLKSLPLSQTRLHTVERGRQRTEVIVLHHRQALAVVACRHTLGSFSEIADWPQ